MNKISNVFLINLSTNHVRTNMDQYSSVFHELEPAYGGQTACVGLLDKTNYHRAVFYTQ